MIRRSIAILILLAALTGGAWFANGEGTLTLSLSGYEIQTGAGTAAILLVLFAVLVLFAARLGRFLFRAPRRPQSRPDPGP